ncbi:hypothetical protein GCM10022251_80610 [Phytohabitans flavus]|uniref:Histidine kinase n=1 Tax=Phytohabitans flavus TaxID=1076124 RepID=A0A6F8XPW3_9ACTN|nr:hypothetical protein [Phytohabitans flavus]BCB75874.1 hypothetical protein Pflav_022840 [Phytohabitans flavus]
MRTPFGIGVATGAAVTMAATIGAAVLFPRGDTSGRLLVVAVAVGAYAALSTSTRATLATALVGYLIFNGFLVNRFGELSWDGGASVGHVTVLAVATALGLGQRWIRHARHELDGEQERGEPKPNIRPAAREPR